VPFSAAVDLAGPVRPEHAVPKGLGAPRQVPAMAMSPTPAARVARGGRLRAYQPLAASALAILLRGTVGLGTLKSNQLRTSSSTPMPCMKL